MRKVRFDCRVGRHRCAIGQEPAADGEAVVFRGSRDLSELPEERSRLLVNQGWLMNERRDD